MKQITELVDAELRLMVNEGCIYKCPYKAFHDNFVSHASRKGASRDIFLDECLDLKRQHPYLLLTSDWLLPQWLKYYKGVAYNFKIVGRTRPTKWIKDRVTEYFNEKSSGNLLEIMSSGLSIFAKIHNCYIDSSHFDDNFFKKVTSCDRNCSSCGYCIDLAEKVIEFN